MMASELPMAEHPIADDLPAVSRGALKRFATILTQRLSILKVTKGQPSGIASEVEREYLAARRVFLGILQLLNLGHEDERTSTSMKFLFWGGRQHSHEGGRGTDHIGGHDFLDLWLVRDVSRRLRKGMRRLIM